MNWFIIAIVVFIIIVYWYGLRAVNALNVCALLPEIQPSTFYTQI